METTKLIPVRLPNGSDIFVEATVVSAEQDVAFIGASFGEIAEVLEGIAESINSAIEKVKPKKASVELGLEIGIESGKLTTLLVKGTGKANLKIAMHWEN
jgi:hypothetical protein